MLSRFIYCDEVFSTRFIRIAPMSKERADIRTPSLSILAAFRQEKSSSLRLHPVLTGLALLPRDGTREMELVTRYRSATVAGSNGLPWVRSFSRRRVAAKTV
jgi:hypothetical protein